HKIVPIDLDTPDRTIINEAAALIQDGQLVAFPTETVYGLGADTFNQSAIQAIFSVKHRPSTDPLIVHIGSIQELSIVAIKIPEIALTLAHQFWPGPLTLILEKQSNIPHAVTAGGPSVAVRYPDHRIAQLLIATSGCPIAAPSANRFSRPSPTLANHVFADLNGKIPMILDGGPTNIGLESTVLDLTHSCPCILRPGGISMEQIQSVIPDVQIRKQFFDVSHESQHSPGQLFKHYSPKAPLCLFTGHSIDDVTMAMYVHMEKLLNMNQSVGAMLVEEDLELFKPLAKDGGLIQNLGSVNKLDIVAKNLFACMRRLDSANVDCILIHMLPKNEIGLAIQDRLFRAAEKVIQV
ncbi:MAG: tRNA threonylcarbamoyladenosine biosynthesis protein, partial [Candidatus Magnetoglobus multicellularis str. Araruama]